MTIYDTIIDSCRVIKTSATNTLAMESSLRDGAAHAPASVLATVGIDNNNMMAEPSIVQSNSHTINSLAADDAPAAGITVADLERIWNWNKIVPVPVERCVHEMIEERVQKQPDATAICAWDGELTYRELNEIASQLAGQLISLGVGIGTIVPLCFEKSMWTTVAIFGVLKTGAAFLLLEPSLPEQRLGEIVQQIEATVLVSSVSSRNLGARLVKTVVELGRESVRGLKEIDATFKSILPPPSSPLLVIFTSGSTGTPKGVVISHGNYASAIRHQEEVRGLTQESRVFEYSPYNFDVCFSYTARTLVAGGCLCVPSEDDRRDRLAESIVSLKANLIDLTPSVLRTLDPSTVPGVRTLVLGGEHVLAQDLEPWWNRVRVIQMYGPAECTESSTINATAKTVQEAASIGRGTGAVTWVVDPDNHDRLMPIGEVGEVILEGPIVGVGYLKNPELTAAKFVHDPAWLIQGVPGISQGRRGRLYKTGDLVRYNEDGSLTFIGRKDTQVKIRGNRVELAEVEQRIQRCLPGNAKLVVEPVQLGHVMSKALVVFIQTNDDDSTCTQANIELGDKPKMIPIEADLEAKLAAEMPNYMLPTGLVYMSKLPMTRSGKTDRRRLRELIEGIGRQELADSSAGRGHSKRQPKTEVERILQQVWSKVLLIEPASIGMDDSFLRMGGDSILAMQAASAARFKSIKIRTVDILRGRTIANIARKLTMVDNDPKPENTIQRFQTDPETDASGPFSLSPMQSLYMQLQSDPTVPCDLFFFLKVRRHVNQATLRLALEALVRRHDMLRARFRKGKDGTWEQYITPNSADSFHVKLSSETTASLIASDIAHCREQLDIQHGPLLRAVLFDGEGDDQRLFLTVHHISVDLVSWHIILRELESLLSLGTVDPLSSMSFRTWIRLQEGHSKTSLLQGDSSDKSLEIKRPELSYWGLNGAEANMQIGVVIDKLILDQQSSSSILGHGGEAFGARPLEIFVAALVYSFNAVFDDYPTPPQVFCEGHGREPWDDGIDVSTTVGWFTTIWPVLLPEGHRAVSLGDTIREVSKPIRNLPQNGWSWFTSHCSSQSRLDKLATKFPQEISLNYEGVYQYPRAADSLFERMAVPVGSSPTTDQKLQRLSLFDVDIRVEEGKIVTFLSYHKKMKHQERIEKWSQAYIDALNEAAQLLNNDFVIAEFASAHGDGNEDTRSTSTSLHKHIVQESAPGNRVVAVAEQSFPQEGLWYNEALHPGLLSYVEPYRIQLRGQLDLDALEKAIWALEHRHETLRTIFKSENGANLQVVLAFEPKRLKIIDVATMTHDEEQMLLTKDQTTLFDLQTEPGWRVTVYRRAAEDHILSIVLHHIITDGWSFGVLRGELSDFYAAALRGEDPLSQRQPLPMQYREYSALQRQPSLVEKHKPQLDYWMSQLESSRPAELPCDKPRPTALSGQGNKQKFRITGHLYKRLQQFCHEAEITPNVALLAAFRATHFRLTGAEDATIGAVNANRDAWQLKDMIGFFVNMQCIRIKVEENTNFADLAMQVDATVASALDNSDVPFASILSKLRVARDLSRTPLVQVAFGYFSDLLDGPFTFQDVQTQWLPAPVASRFDLEFRLYKQTDAIHGEAIFATELFEPETVANMISVFSSVLEKSLETPTLTIQSLPLLGEDGLNLLEEIGVLGVDRREYSRESSIAEAFRQQARLTPDQTAVVDSSLQITYAELDYLSDLLCSWLVRQSLPAESLIGVLANRSCNTVVAFLGVLKANLAYLPLDGGLPSARIEVILSSVKGRKLVLVGQDICIPTLQDAEFVRINDILQEKGATNKDTLAADVPKPNSNSLAYVMFTSGSTGKPKGVMIEHANILHVSKNNNFLDSLPSPPVMSHIASISFDMSTHEVYPTILNGGTLVCLSAGDVIEPAAVANIFSKHKVNSLIITPSLLHQYLNHCPETFGSIQTVCVGGEAARPDDLRRLRNVMRGGRILNGYGPTENTCVRAIYVVPADGVFANGVPIGNAVSNSGAYVTDALQRLVPVGVVGELVVTGEGLARGYLDPRQDTDKFITMRLCGEEFRAYRTGDLVRRLPVGGQLEYIGRLDGQVKVRGHRVELGEVEDVMGSHYSVSEAVAVIQRDSVVGFVTLQESAGAGDAEESQLVELWEGRFNSSEYTGGDGIMTRKLGRDFMGWTSMYDGQEIDHAEMNEWLDDTIQTILNGKHPHHVLEVGTGSGMILFNLGVGLESYSGIELSRHAVDYVATAAKSIPELNRRVHMFKGTAADVTRVKLPFPPNLVIVNSVAQYFPSRGYLLRMIQDLANLPGVETIVLGDIRSYTLHQAFCVSKLLHSAADDMDQAAFESAMAKTMASAVPELLVDPAFFTQLVQLFPNTVHHVEILPKMMRATNELSCYRYAAVIHVKQQSMDAPATCVKEVGQDNWIDFEQQGLDRDSLSALLKNTDDMRPGDDVVVAVSNIPNRKIALERQILEFLHQPAKLQQSDTGSGWLPTLRRAANKRPSLSATDLVEVANTAGYRVEISWARQVSGHGSLDAVFHRRASGHTVVKDSPHGVERVLFSFPNDNFARPGAPLTSQPLLRQIRDKAQRELASMLRAKLPKYAVPNNVTVLDAMPLNSSGKIDRRALSNLNTMNEIRQTQLREVSSDTERVLRQIWGQVLNIDPATISADDSFFQLGGDSIKAMQVSTSARAHNLLISTADVIQNVLLHQLAAAVTR
ncbi:hypothetical protein V8C35DRAFT_328181 [Trichoderma chlorosporum]